MGFKEWLKLTEVGGAGPGGTEPVQPAAGFAATGAIPHYDASGDTTPPDGRKERLKARKGRKKTLGVKFT